MSLNAKKKEVERKEQELVERQLNSAKAHTRQRAAKKAEQERLENMRTGNIERLNKEWLTRETKSILQEKQKAIAKMEEEEEYYEAARARKHAVAEEMLQERIEIIRYNAELEGKRAEIIEERNTQRDIKEIHRIDTIKNEAREELQSFIINPAPVPLKQVLTGRVRPVPRVTELLAAHKDQREDLELLKNADISLLAEIDGTSLFLYVQKLRQRAEGDRIRPPEPTDGDLGRSKVKSRKPGSPKGPPKGRKTGTLSPTSSRKTLS